MTNEHIFLDDGLCECCGKNSIEEHERKKLSLKEKKKMLDYICGKDGGYGTIEMIELSLYALISDANEIIKQVDDLREYVDTLSKLE